MADSVEFIATIEGVEPIKQRMSLLIDDASDMRPAWNEIRGEWVNDNELQINSQGTHAGTKYAALSPKYAALKRKKWPGKIILRTGPDRMYNGLTNPSSPDFIYRPRRQAMVIGITGNVAQWHFTGTEKMPRRMPIAASIVELKKWAGIIARQIFKHLKPGSK